ncbi:MAG: hypothetical protein HOB14_11495 [Gammaproteobacteria bacterium]|jgi:hypothetical protein|nr:hypothetical protein [Gammaproteobacteria bacterium]MBT3723949.1 hypothetical protein [Gammaproteobacteria bacterium]MBT4077190.1 hypothetical protein [Gammaproteobacteria bacterium]MBT4195931.1 hypothetical protein [Gammaproteobacteria bacterium]MBT4862837.1 hypothetical protein [Gammaproteobacteria bacterium]
MENITEIYTSNSAFLFLCGVIAAKWGLELGVSQFRQFLLFIAGCLFGPVILVLQYIYLVYMYKEQNRSGHQLFSPASRDTYNKIIEDRQLNSTAKT